MNKNHLSDYINEYTNNPFAVDLKVHSMKAGMYHVVGDVSDSDWEEACERIGVEKGGCCFVDVEIEKRAGFLYFTGNIKMQTKRTCVRTLQEFMLDESFEIEDRLCLAAEKAEEMDEVYADETLEVKDFLSQQIVLEMENYPVHPSTHSTEAGAFDVEDGQEKEVNEEKNPFSVLKHLKS